MFDLTVADCVGMLGATLIVIAYFLMQIGRLDALSLAFSAANALGASGIIFSLYYEFNLSAFAIEAFWLAISLYGMFRALRARNSLSRDAARLVDD